jgi:hypothetical protein
MPVRKNLEIVEFDYLVFFKEEEAEYNLSEAKDIRPQL